MRRWNAGPWTWVAAGTGAGAALGLTPHGPIEGTYTLMSAWALGTLVVHVGVWMAHGMHAAGGAQAAGITALFVAAATLMVAGAHAAGTAGIVIACGLTGRMLRARGAQAKQERRARGRWLARLADASQGGAIAGVALAGAALLPG